MTQVTPKTALEIQSSPDRAPVLAYTAVRPVGAAYVWQQTKTSLPLALGDVFAVIASTAFATLVCGPIFGWSVLFTVGFLSLGTVCALSLLGLYPGIGVHPAYEMKRVLTVISIICVCLLFVSMEGTFALHRSWWSVVLLWLTWSAIAPTMRSTTRSVFKRFDWWTQAVLFLGTGPDYQVLSREIDRHRAAGLRPIGYFHDTRQQWFGEEVDEFDVLGDLNEANEYARRNNVFWAIVLEQTSIDDDESTPVNLSEIPHRVFRRNASDTTPSIWDEFFYVDKNAFIHQTDKLLLPHNLWFKRAMDFFLAAVLVIFSAPLVVVLALIVKTTSRGPVFFKSERIGADGKLFAMTKFRTMQSDAEAYLKQYLEKHPECHAEWEREHKLKNDPRITWIGKLLRRTSLDELPQIYDVLFGKMSLVGPRPMLLSEPGKYGPHYQSFCRMLPGMTGLWQVSGRNRIPHDQRTILVSYYVQNWSPWLDLYLLAKTFKVVITGDGAY